MSITTVDGTQTSSPQPERAYPDSTVTDHGRLSPVTGDVEALTARPHTTPQPWTRRLCRRDRPSTHCWRSSRSPGVTSCPANHRGRSLAPAQVTHPSVL